ncbi:hypothetical protein [Kitasatospora sp. NPDC057223]|uniref:hypothetical protein n=1 Tax=Kitasatospora sp. NPDC057223 TaxID=3346055 RepID=UPI003638D24E
MEGSDGAMTVHQESRIRPSAEQDAQALRAELDELLRARQYATQRERHLAEAVQAAAQPDRDHGYAHPQQRPDPDLLRQLDHARHLREGLGARCLELSERLLGVEDHLRRRIPEPAPAPAPVTAPAPVPEPRRKRPTGARFGGVYEQEPAAPAPVPVTAPAAPRATGARFGGVHTGAPEAAPQPPVAAAAPAPAAAPQPRTQAELTALATRIGGLHRRGSTHESAALVAQAAVTLTPADVSRLAALLRSGGPAGAAAYLARAVAHGTPGHAAGTLAELRRAGLSGEATELFHALWGYPAATLPELLAALEHTGQGADGQTLLWEWGSAPPAELAALAALLAAADRPADTRTLLRQAAAMPVPQVAELAATLDGQLAAVLLRELVALRPPTDLALVAGGLTGDPGRYAALLDAVAESGEGRQRAAAAALRSAGLPTAAEPPRGRRGRR